MLYNEDIIDVDQVIRLELDGKFDGYAKLIAPTEKIFTRIQNDSSRLIKRQRWLIEWVEVERAKLTNEEYFTQKSLIGKRAYRILEFTNGNRWNFHEGKVTDGDDNIKENFELKDNYGKHV